MRLATFPWLLILGLAPSASGSNPPEDGRTRPDTLALQWTAPEGPLRVGERLVLRASTPVTTPGERLRGPDPGSFGPVDVVAGGPVPAGADSAAWRLELALFEVGEVDLSRLPFRVEGSGDPRPAGLRDARVQVERTLSDTAGAEDLRDIKGPVTPPLGWRWGRLLAAAGLLVLLAVALAVWRRRAGRPVVLDRPPEPERTPEEIALAALGELERAAYPLRGRMKDHYAELSAILRRYVEVRFELPAVESTTREIRIALEGSGGREVAAPGALLELLEASDLVKFAKGNPGPDAARSALGEARSWVRGAAPAPPAEEASRGVP